MGWSQRWSTQGSMIDFTQTLKTIEIVTLDLANLPTNLARI
jgi:aryl carrier-like protein